MVSGKYLTSPVLLINLAGEMFYVLNQRLITQSLQQDRCLKILNDIAVAIFNQAFITQLFLNNKTVSLEFLKTIFQKLVHSSVMKLSSQSFSKLFDLMLMGVKLQIFLSSSPLQLYAITINHLEGILQLVKGGTSQQMLQATINKFKNKYQKLTFRQYLEIKLEMLNKLKAQNLRIFTFLESFYQDRQKGFLYMYRRYAPHLSQPVGTCIYPDFKQQLALGSREFKLNTFTNADFKSWNSELGRNMYIGILPLKGFNENKHKFEPTKILKKQEYSIPDRSLNQMILGQNETSQITYTIQIFSQSDNKQPISLKKKNEQQIIGIKPKYETKNLKQNILNEFQSGEKQVEEEDDLLAMMDQAMQI